MKTAEKSRKKTLISTYHLLLSMATAWYIKDSNKYINKSNICHAYVTENDKIFLIKQDKRRN